MPPVFQYSMYLILTHAGPNMTFWLSRSIIDRMRKVAPCALLLSRLLPLFFRPYIVKSEQRRKTEREVEEKKVPATFISILLFVSHLLSSVLSILNCCKSDKMSSSEDSSSPLPPSSVSSSAISSDFFPTGPKALSGIALRAAILGAVFSCSLLISVYLFVHNLPFHLPLFFALLALFHYLEFWTTAQYNTPNAKISCMPLSPHDIFALCRLLTPNSLSPGFQWQCLHFRPLICNPRISDHPLPLSCKQGTSDFNHL